MLHAVIMAGGSGTRFWPESRQDRPKQLLKLFGERTMIEATVARLGDAFPPERVLIVTNVKQAHSMARLLPQLPPESILAEPCKRDTAPCIALAAMQLLRSDPDATMVVMPADHVIRPDEAFQQALRAAAELVDASPERIVTFGIRPTYAAESFGYIERGERLGEARGAPLYRVAQFREKPRGEVARRFFESGDFYWNAGIFAWKAATILRAIETHQPEMYRHLQRIDEAFGMPDYLTVLETEFSAIEGVSIDYAVMEHAQDVAVIEAPFEWDDVGSWQSLARLAGTDENGNTIRGKHLGLDTRGTIIRGEPTHLIATMGLRDLLIVQTPDATLVANKHDEESVRQLVRLLEERGWQEYL